MRVPTRLEPLVEMGIIDEVQRPLMSGKEAQLHIVMAGGELRVAKVYKAASQRSFKRRDDYTEGRRVRNSRDRRAMEKRSRHGRERDEAAWQTAEVDAIYRLRAAGVRVPTPYDFVDGVLVMELVTDEHGRPAPRLSDIALPPSTARGVYDQLVQEVVRMLCAGVVHGDLSDYNVLMGAAGPVIIDFPQVVDVSSNRNARRLLARDVDNLHRFLSRFTAHRRLPYAQEMWEMFEANALTPDTRLCGRFRDNRRRAGPKPVFDLLSDAGRDGQRRGEQAQPRSNTSGSGRNISGGGRGPKVEIIVRTNNKANTHQPDARDASRGGPAAKQEQAPAKRRRRRRRRGRSENKTPTASDEPAHGG